MNEKELFLKELSELSKKHKIYIGGCGCCDSPYAMDENNTEVLKQIEWNYEKEMYEEDI